ncbi:BLUF domain-containing protein [Paracoccus fistulariae]|uniref:BLUF domain-containing protein n=1 Tax=Paracoccus fistulariae TaxID=658446 RepID=A0ABY7SPB3_9RHOB|nr:BLUF domain-containing protein [Paracoccus fistulariae]MDB6179769.1 BLUF domain-containing protein [Paracoccus fistulariae]WCR07881.1 BLUF domain-containing protein [Paracoccus fistulariae]
MTNELTHIDGLAYVIYRSSAVDHLRDEDLDDILISARARNEEKFVTGCLHYEDGMFFQWIEGPAEQLRQIIDLILKDERHRDIAVLGVGALEVRRFQDWRMRFSDRKNGSLMDWFACSEISTFDRKEYIGGVVTFLASLKV